jgi:hypothetical protein
VKQSFEKSGWIILAMACGEIDVDVSVQVLVHQLAKKWGQV